jgi:protein gp37
MADKTGIEWTDATWNPIRGCTRVSEGCRNCYAETQAARFSGPGMPYEGLAERTSKGPRWTGKVMFVESALDQPLRWARPRKIFVNSMSDLFHESIPDEWIDRIFAVMALARQHTFQVLTKRPERMRKYLSTPRWHIWSAKGRTMAPARWQALPAIMGGDKTPVPNVHLGVSVEDQATADQRISVLLATPGAVRFISAEPLLGPVDASYYLRKRLWVEGSPGEERTLSPVLGMGKRIDWVIVGGESGPGARVWPSFEDACRSLRDQCAEAGVPFFMKQMQGVRKAAMPPIPQDLMIRQFPEIRS